MNRITKREIINAGLSGLPVYGEWVCKIKRGSKGTVLIQRHAWEKEGGSPAGDAVSKACKRYASELATKRGNSVEIYTSDACMLDQIFPTEVES